MHRSKDFIATAEKLIFAVVTDGNELGKVRCFLRYACVDGGWRKIHSGEANRFLADHFPQYLFHSILLDADLHGVPVSAISRHYLPLSGLQDLLNNFTIIRRSKCNHRPMQPVFDAGSQYADYTLMPIGIV